MDDERLKQGGSRYFRELLQRKLLTGNGKVSHKQAMEKAEREFEIYRAREMRQMESDFDRAVKQIMNKEDQN